MKNTTYILFSLTFLFSCVGGKSVESQPSNQIVSKVKVSKENVFENILSVINGKIDFYDITITYEDLIHEFSKEYRETFEKDAGELFKDRFPKWRDESINVISQICSEDDATMTNTIMKLQKDDGELKAYTGEFTLICSERSYLLRFSAFETNKNFYVSQIVLPNN